MVASRTLPPSLVSLTAAAQDTFSHQQHQELACTTCHATAEGHGALTFAAPRGCQLCHHQRPAQSECSACHEPPTLQSAMLSRVRVTVTDTLVRERPVHFRHEQHAEIRCVQCHTAPVTLATAAAVRGCTDCHDDHHAAQRSCVSCHASEQVEQAHAPPIDAHVACDACHRAATVERLVPDRSFCLTCHEPQAREHYPDRECTVCHMLASPEGYRGRWTARGVRR